MSSVGISAQRAHAALQQLTHDTRMLERVVDVINDGGLTARALYTYLGEKSTNKGTANPRVGIRALLEGLRVANLRAFMFEPVIQYIRTSKRSVRALCYRPSLP